jgi:hypothetical protein
MSAEWTISWVWWITAVELPVLGSLFWLVHHGRREGERALLKMYSEIRGHLSVVVENLSHSKLEVARLYATAEDLKDVEKRLTDHLLRLETRLTYAISGPEPRARWAYPMSASGQIEARQEDGHGRD